MSFYRETPVNRTRRICRCCWCEEAIEAGQPSIYIAGIFEGDFFTDRMHPECKTAATRWYDENDCWGEPWPCEAMNRGGIQPKGEKESR